MQKKAELIESFRAMCVRDKELQAMSNVETDHFFVTDGVTDGFSV